MKVYRGSDLCPLQSIEGGNGGGGTTQCSSWASDAAILTLNGQKRLCVAFHDRSLAFFNILLAEKDPDRPDETSTLGFGGTLHASAAAGVATCLGALPASSSSSTSTLDDTQNEEKLLFGDQKGKVHLLSRGPPTMGVSLDFCEGDTQQLHGFHTQTVTQLLHVPHVGVVSSSLDGSIAIFDPLRGAIAASSKVHGTCAVRCLANHQPLSVAVSGGAGRGALLWHPRGDPGRAVGELSGHVNGVLSISTATMHAEEYVIATLSGVGAVKVWDLRTLRALCSLESTSDFPNHEDVKPTAIAFDQEHQRLMTGTRRPCVWHWGRKKEEEENSDFEGRIAQQNEEKIDSSDDGEVVKQTAIWQRAHSHLRLHSVDDA